MKPLVPSWVYDLAVLVAITVIPASCWIWGKLEEAAARRRARDRRTDEQIARGMREAKRRGWLS